MALAVRLLPRLLLSRPLPGCAARLRTLGSAEVKRPLSGLCCFCRRRLGSGAAPFPRSLLGLRGLGPVCSVSSASLAQPPRSRRNPPHFPFLPPANLQHRGAAAASENQNDHSGVLQPHQLGSDSEFTPSYLGLFRQSSASQSSQKERSSLVYISRSNLSTSHELSVEIRKRV